VLPATAEPAAPDLEASFPATPKAVPTEAPAPTPSAPSAGQAPDGAAGSGVGAGGDGGPSAGQERSPEAPAPTRSTAAPAPSVPSGVPVAAPAPPAPSANVVYSSPGAPAPSPSAALEATLRMAGENGFTRARVTLRPAELGGVEVFLREGSAGLTATVVAETPHAAQLLESTATELQRRLAAHGLELSSLQISVGGESAGAAHGGRDGQAAARASGTGARGDAAEPAATAEQSQTIDLGGGVLVDVLA